jgi:branched-chain amino acid transport system ATP-binding protein
MTLLAARDIGIRLGGLTILDKISLQVDSGKILAVIGPNGAGKTTLFNVLSGIYKSDTGTVFLHNKPVTALAPFKLAQLGMTRTFQNLQIFDRMSAIENVMVGRHLHERRNPLLHFLGLPGVRRQNELSMAKAASLLDFVGLPGVAQRPAGELPYGALKRLEIARALAVEPRVLLLDEPVAGCNAVESAEVAAVIRKVADTGVAVLLVEHDMHLVMNLADRIHVLERGRTLFEGTAQEVKSHPAVIEAYLGAPKKVEAEHA